MSVPNPVNVTTSTTQIQINPLESPYTPVLLNQVQYPGQVVTIVDGTSSFGILTTPIVVSTAITNSFLDGSISTLINQPQGFITAQTFSTNKWTFLNSFPFRNQYFSAGLLNLTTSTLFTALTSTIFETVDFLTVENLTVTGNFVQSQGITLNTNVSTLGTVDILSSLLIWGNTYLSSAMSTYGAVNLYSSLYIGSDFTTLSSIVTQSSFYVSGSVIALGLLSTPSVELQDGLVGTTLDVSTSQMTFADIGGSLKIENTVSTNSTVSLGGFLKTSETRAASAIFLSSASLYQTAEINSFLSTLQNFSTTGSLGVGSRLNVGLDLTVKDTVNVNADARIQDLFIIQSTLVTSSMHLGVLEVQGDYTNNSTITTVSNVTVDTNLGGGFVSSASTFISGFLTMYGNLGTGNLTLESYLDVLGGISSLGNVSSGRDFLIEGSISSFGTTSVSSMSSFGELTVQTSTITSLLRLSTNIQGDLFGLGDLYCGGTLTISSITLPSSLIANNFTTGTALIGTVGIVNQTDIDLFVASSITFGYIENSPYQFDLSGSLFLNSTSKPAVSLSTNLLSTSIYRVPNLSSSYIRVESAMAINTPLQSNSFICEPIGYFLSSPVTVQSTFSTGYILANTIDGTLIGDGSLLSNIVYPTQISAAQLLINGELFINSFSPTAIIASTLQIDELVFGTAFVNSTVSIGGFQIAGNERDLQFTVETNNIQTSSFTLLVNNVQFIGNGTGTVSRRVGINEENLDYPVTATLGVFSTLAADSFNYPRESSPALDDFRLEIQTFEGNKVEVVESMRPINIRFGSIFNINVKQANLYLSSGTISTIAGPFFLGENQEYDSRYNIVQPYQSTLQFNSTLFINRETNSVGINTQPNFSLDAESIYVDGTIKTDFATVTNEINLSTNLSTLYFAFVDSNSTRSNTLVTSDIDNLFVNLTLETDTYRFKGGFSPGISRQSNLRLNPEKFISQYLFGNEFSGGIFGLERGLISLMVPFAGRFVNLTADYNANPPDTFRGMATDALYTVACGTIEPQYESLYFDTLFLTPNEDIPNYFFLFPIDSNIFPSYSFTFYRRGGHDIIYGGVNAPIWITVGVGSNGPIWRSTDAINWSVVDIGQYELYSIVSTELPFNGGIVFLTGGAELIPSGPNNGSFTPTGGYVFASKDLGVTWKDTGLSCNVGVVKQLATNGKLVVAAVDATTPFATLFFSFFYPDNTFIWESCFGDTFQTRANSVIWSGSNFVAGGDLGIRISLDGVTWTNPNTVTTEVNNLAFTSNAATTIRLNDTMNVILFQDSPNLQNQRLISAPTISYYPNGILNLNNGCLLDDLANIICLGSINNPSPFSQAQYFSQGDSQPLSSFYTVDGFVSTFVSTSAMTLGAYKVGLTLVL